MTYQDGFTLPTEILEQIASIFVFAFDQRFPDGKE